jgi:hypothetical protein
MSEQILLAVQDPNNACAGVARYLLGVGPVPPPAPQDSVTSGHTPGKFGSCARCYALHRRTMEVVTWLKTNAYTLTRAILRSVVSTIKLSGRVIRPFELRCSALDAGLVTFPVRSVTRATVPSACFLTIQLPSLPRLFFLMFPS